MTTHAFLENRSSFLTETNSTISLNYDSDVVTVQQKQFLTPMMFIGMLSLIGVPGNILVLFVFCFKHKKTVHNTIIINLAFYDLLLCAITLPFEIYDMNNQFTFNSKWVCKIFRTLNYFFIFNSGYSIFLMAVDRYRRVCRPLKIQMTFHEVRIIIILIFVFSLVLTSPNVFIRGLHVIKLSENLTGSDCTISDQYINSQIPAIYNGVLLCVCFLNIIMLIILYVLIGREICIHFRYNKTFKTDSYSARGIATVSSYMETSISKDESSSTNRKGHKKTGKYQNKGQKKLDDIDKNQKNTGKQKHKGQKKLDDTGYKITKIAIIISVLCILSYIPSLTESILEGVYGVETLSDYISTEILHLIQKSFAINHVVNPIIYAFMDNTFRNDCKEIVSITFRKCIRWRQ